jgi:predicted TIM-barrel fold metal-dependent hydrolase
LARPAQGADFRTGTVDDRSTPSFWHRPGWRYLLDDLLLDTGSGHNIIAAVHMEANSMYRDRGPEEMRPVGEVEFANGVAAMCDSGVFGKTTGIVGHADMMLGSRVEPVLTALMRAGGDHFRGIRHRVSWEAEAATLRPNPSTRAGMLADKKLREGVTLVGHLGLSYDVSLYHTRISEVADLASALPNTRIVLNDVGGVLGLGSYRSKRDEVFARWSSSIKALAAQPNVFVKLGLGQSYTSLRFDEDAEPPSSEIMAARFRPHIETCIAAFGTFAMYSGMPVHGELSNWPIAGGFLRKESADGSDSPNQRWESDSG